MRVGKRFIWTDEETQFLIDNYSDMPNSDLATRLNTTIDSVKNKVIRLKSDNIFLSKSPEHIKRMQKKSNDDVRRWWNEGNVDAKYENKRLKSRNTIIKKLNGKYNLTEDQIQVMLGSCIGNASMRRQYNGPVDALPYIVFTHCNKHKEYIDWKCDIFDPLLIPGGMEFYNYNHNTFGEYGYYRCSTRHLPCFIPYYNILRPGDIERIVTKKWIGLIDIDNPLALAVFYMDVGCNYEQYSPLTNRRYTRIRMSLGLKTDEEVKLIVKWIKRACGVDVRYYRVVDPVAQTLKEQVIAINRQEDVKVFIDYVRPVVEQVKCMLHLIDMV